MNGNLLINRSVMPTIFVDSGYRFFFFSREETRRHVHVSGPNGEVKIEVAKVVNLSDTEVNRIQRIVNSRLEEINEFWDKHFN